MRSTEACYINKTYVEKLGYTLPETLTWDFIWEVSEAVAKQDAQGNYLVNGQKVMIPFIYKSTDNMMIQMLRQLDAGYSTSSGDIQLFNDTTKELLSTIAQHVETAPSPPSRSPATPPTSSTPASVSSPSTPPPAPPGWAPTPRSPTSVPTPLWTLRRWSCPSPSLTRRTPR